MEQIRNKIITISGEPASGKPPVDINSPLYMKTLYDWVEGLQYYGGKIGNITQYKNFGIRDLASIENVPIAREVLKLNKK